MVSIVGGGPAGASLATFLSREMDGITLFERNPEKRKPCGGGLTWRVLEKYGETLSLKDVPMYGSKEIYADFEGKVVRIKSRKPLVYVADRLILDNHLRDLAQSQGATVEKKSVLDIGEVEDDVIVDSRGFEPSKNQYSLKVSMCKMNEPKMMFAWRRKMLSKGYFWVFPIDESHADVGVGGVVGSIKVSLKDAFDWFCKEVGAIPEVNMGWGISINRNFSNLITEIEGKKIIKVGERAKIVNPLTGEGIYYAMRSAELLSQCLLKDNIGSYEGAVKKEWGGEFLVSDMLLSTIPIMPRSLFIFLLKSAPKIFFKNIEVTNFDGQILKGP